MYDTIILGMRRSTSKRRRTQPAKKDTSSWLPIDTRFFPDIIHFGHVRGFSRVFLTIEICLVTIVMVASAIIACLKVFI